MSHDEEYYKYYLENTKASFKGKEYDISYVGLEDSYWGYDSSGEVNICLKGSKQQFYIDENKVLFEIMESEEFRNQKPIILDNYV